MKKSWVHLEEKWLLADTILNSLPVTIYIYDFKAREFDFVNKPFRDLFGFSETVTLQNIKKTLIKTFNKEFEETLTKRIEKLELLKDEETYDMEIRFKNKFGVYKWLMIRERVFTRDLEGNVNTIIGKIIDITDKVMIQRKLDAERKKNELLVKREQKLRNIAMLKSMDEERNRISRDIHDGLGQMLTGLKINIQNLNDEKELSIDGKITLNKINNLMKEIISETRRLSNEITPRALNDLGLKPVIQHLLDTSVKQHFKMVNFNTNVDHIRFDAHIELTLFRIIQETINNAIKYANASEIRILLNYKSNQIVLEITDNGVGFDFNKFLNNTDILNFGKNGLNNIVERIRLLYGKVDFKSEPNKFSSIQVIIPAQQLNL